MGRAGQLGRELLRCLWLDVRQGMQHSAIGQGLTALGVLLSGGKRKARPEDLDALSGLPCARRHLGVPCPDRNCWRRPAAPPIVVVCLDPDCRGINHKHAPDCGLSFGTEFAQRCRPMA